MDRMVTTCINGEPRELNYSVEVMFDVVDRFGTINKALEMIERDGLEAFEVVKWFALRMANDAELCRRDAGYDHKPMLDQSAISLRIRPIDYELLKGAVVEAISRGYTRESTGTDQKEVDLGLAELQEKKAKAGAG